MQLYTMGIIKRATGKGAVSNVYGTSKGHLGSGYDENVNAADGATYRESIVVLPIVISAGLFGLGMIYAMLKIWICGIACL